MLNPGPQTGTVITANGQITAERDANGTLTLNGMLWAIGQGQAVTYNGTIYTDAATLNAAISKVGAAVNWQMIDQAIGGAIPALQEAIRQVDVQAAAVALSPNTTAATALAARRTLLASVVTAFQGYIAADGN